MIDGEVAHAQDGPERGERLVVVRRKDGLYQYRQEWMEADDGDGNGPYPNYRESLSLFGSIDDALREAGAEIAWLNSGPAP